MLDLKKLAKELPEALPGLLGFLKQVERDFSKEITKVRSESFEDDEIWYELQPFGPVKQLTVGTYSTEAGEDVQLLTVDYNDENNIVGVVISYILLNFAREDVGNFDSMLRELKVLLYNEKTPTYLETASKKVLFVICDEDDEDDDEDEDE